MKTLFVFVLSIICVVSVQAQDKATVFGLKAGVNGSVMSASENDDISFRFGFNAGAYMVTGSNGFHFRSEIYYSQQGQGNKYVSGSGSQAVATSTLKLGYVNVPLLVEFGKKVRFQAGPQIGFLTSASEVGKFNGQDVTINMKDRFKSTDVGIVAGVAVYPSGNFNYGFRAIYGLTTVTQPAYSDPAMANRNLQVYVGYAFGR